MADVTGRLIGKFAENLAKQITGDNSPATTA